MKIIKILPYFIFILPSLFLLPSPSFAERKVDNYDRLNLLRQATGTTPTATSSYEARLDAIFNPAAQPERSLVVQEDAQKRAANLTNQQQILAQANSRLETNPKPYDDGLIRGKDATLKEKTKIDNSEEAYQKSLEESRKPKKEKQPEQEKEESPSKEGEEKNGLDPALANNPFYKGQPKEEDPAKKFELMKPILISRIAQTPPGDPMGQLGAESLVSQASNLEELTVILLKDNPSLTHQQASELTSVSDEEIPT